MKRSRVVYYAKLESGVIIEDENFRNVYNAVKCEVRSEYGHGLFFDCGSATIYEGVIVEWEEGNHAYFKYLPLRPIVTMRCSSIDRVTSFKVTKGEI